MADAEAHLAADLAVVVEEEEAHVALRGVAVDVDVIREGIAGYR